MKKLTDLLNNYKVMVAIQTLLFAVFWLTSTSKVFPSLPDVLQALGKLWNEGLLREVITSMKLYLVSLEISTVLALAISGLTALPEIKGVDVGNIFKPFAEAFAKFRYFAMIGFPQVFQLLTPDMYSLKVAILVFGVAPWIVMSLNNILESTPKKSLDYARTLRLSELRVALEVKIWGNKDKAIEAFRQSAAMGLMMLTVGELLSRDSGGISVVLAGDQKWHNVASIFAVQVFVLLLIGIVQDTIIRLVRAVWCPYAVMLEENKQ